MALSSKSSVLPIVVLRLCLLGTLADTVAFPDSPSPAKPQPTVSQIKTPANKSAGNRDAASRSGTATTVSKPYVSPQESLRTSLDQLKRPSLSTAVFIENVGQFDPKVKYQTRIGRHIVWLTSNGLVFDALRDEPNKEHRVPNASTAAPGGVKPEAKPVEGLVFAEDFAAAGGSKLEAKGPQPASYNYFESRDPPKWRTNVHAYSEVVYRDLWPGIDLRVYRKGIRPGAGVYHQSGRRLAACPDRLSGD